MARTVTGLKDRAHLFSPPEIFSVLFLLVLIQLTSFYHYLLFHSLAEFFSIAVASTIFVVAINSWKQISNQYLLFIGISYAFIGILDMMHTLSYAGMGIFTDYDYYAPQFWVASRSLEAMSMLAAFALIESGLKLRLSYIVAGYSAITASIIASILYFKIFPICFEPGHGLTPFKIYSEYVIMALFVVNLYLLYQKRQYFDKAVYMLLAASIVVMIVMEYCFTFYSNLAMSGFFNEAGHLLKIIAFYLIYKAIVVTGIRDPIELLFKDLKDNEISLLNAQTLAGLVTWEWNVSKDVCQWSSNFKMVFGVEPALSPGKASLLEMVKPDDQVLLSKFLDDALGEGISIRLPLTLITPSGERFCFLEGGLINDGIAGAGNLAGTLQDLSVQRQLMDIENAKKESLKLLAILRNSSDGVHILDFDGNLVELSDYFCNMLGYSRNEMLGMNVSQWDAHFTDPQELMSVVRRRFQSPEVTRLETKHRRKDGTIIDVEISGFPFELDDKPVLFNSSRDITARKAIEISLQQERRLNASILKLAGPIILVIDNSGAIVSFNKTAEELTGYSFEEVRGKPYFWKNFLLPEERTRVEQMFSLAMAGKLPSQVENCWINANGEKRLIIWSNSLLTEDGGTVISALIAIGVDITEQRQAEAAKQLLGEITQNAAAGIALVKPNGTFHYTNTRFEGMFGYAPGELLGKSVSIVNAPTEKSPEETAKEILSALERNGSWSGEVLNRKKDGTDLWTFANVSSFHDPELGTLLIAHQTDITERKLHEKVLNEFSQEIEDLYENAPCGYHSIDAEGIIVRINQTELGWLGYTREEMVGKPVTDFLTPASQKAVRDVMDRFIKVGHLHGAARELVRKDGTILHAQLDSTAIYDENGKFLMSRSILTDITERKYAEEELKASEIRLKDILNASPISVRIATKQGRKVMFCNKSYANLIKNTNPIEDDPRNYYLNPEEYDEIIEKVSSGKSVNNRQVQLSIRGSLVWVLASYTSIRYVNVEAILGWFYDITPLKHSENELKVAATTFESQEGMMVTDSDGNILRVNEAFSKITGYSEVDVIGKNPRMLQSGRTDAHFYESMWKDIANDGYWSGEIWNRRKSGEIFPEQLSITAVKDDDGRVTNYVGSILDITDRKISEAQIQQLVYYDHLTGLPNRRLFRDRLEQDVKRVTRSKSSLALLFIDLDRFKEVNDTLGHDKGDLLLIEAARRIRQHVRDTDTFARLGGDEFTIVLPEYGELSNIERVVQSVVHDLTIPFDLGNGDVGHISGSVGIALYPEDANSIEDLLKHADQAMYAAKQAGRNGFSYFTRSMQAEAKEKMALINDLHAALERNQLEVYFQPIVDALTGKIVKAEALLRWHHPVHGMIQPSVFIPLAEESGLILEIGEWVFEETLKAISRWQEHTGHLIQVSVNKSPAQFTRAETHPWLKHYLGSGLPQNCIAVEITEGLLLSESEKVKQDFVKFREHGIELSIDDFGTGFSALSYLNRFDVDYLKIDKSFVHRLVTDSSSRTLTEAIILMAHKLGIRTIAEGVETAEQRDLLASFGCDYMQGFLYSKPVPSDEFEKLIVG